MSIRDIRARIRRLTRRQRLRRSPPQTKAWRKTGAAWPTGRLNRIRRWTTDALLIVLLGVLLALLYIELTQRAIVLEPFEVPASLAEQGYTGRVVARKLMDRLHEIRSDVFSVQPHKASDPFPLGSFEFVLQEQEETSPIQMQGATISLTTFARHLEELLGRERLTISGELTFEEGRNANSITEPQSLRVAVRVGTSPAREHTRPFAPSFPTALDTLLCEAAQDFYRTTYPALLAVYLHRRGKSEEALEVAKACLDNSYDQDDVLGLLVWGDILAEKGQLGAALNKYQQAADLEPRRASIHVSLGRALLRADRFDEAEDQFRQAEELGDDIAALHVLWSLLHRKRAEHDAELDRLERATRTDPNYLEGWYYWARTLFLLGRKQEAEDKLQRALEIHPTYPPALLLKKEMAKSEEQRSRIDSLLVAAGEARSQRSHRCPL